MAEPRDHHYAPQFYMRNFAVDPEALKICTVGKSGETMVWSQRSIEGIGYERDFYVHLENIELDHPDLAAACFGFPASATAVVSARGPSKYGFGCLREPA